jgi:hypothetical protein
MSHDRASFSEGAPHPGELYPLAVVHLIEERLFDRPRRVEIEHGGRWWPASQSAWRLCDDGCGWMADVAWTEQHEWGPGKYMTMVSPERIRVV